MLNDITSACWFTYLLLFLTDIGLSPRYTKTFFFFFFVLVLAFGFEYLLLRFINVHFLIPDVV